MASNKHKRSELETSSSRVSDDHVKSATGEERENSKSAHGGTLADADRHRAVDRKSDLQENPSDQSQSKSKITSDSSSRIENPDDELVRVVCISDTHNGHRNPHFDRKIRQIQADILVHAGDFGDRGTLEERIDFWNWLRSLDNIRCKVFISGNMDGIGLDQKRLKKGDRSPSDDPSITYLENSARTIRGLKFYGCPYTPKFYGGFQYNRGSEKAKELWGQIPADCDVLISHGPPAGIFDRTSRGLYSKHHVFLFLFIRMGLLFSGASVGCRDLATAIFVRPAIKAVIFGHIHHSYGQKKSDGVLFINAAQYNGIHEGDTRNKIVELVFNRRTKEIVDVLLH